MMPLDCAEVRELVPELALGVLSGSERAEVLLHASQCTRCQALIGELGEAADALPLLAPEIEPPTDFETRVLGKLLGSRRRNARRWGFALAFTAAAAAIISIVVVQWVDAGNGRTSPSTPVAAVRSVGMVGDHGMRVGRVYASTAKPTAIVVTVDYWVATGTYRVELQPADGPAQRLGTIQIDDGRGSWGGAARLATSGSTRVSLVDSHGAAVCHATLSAPA
jgi:predicted anti-sigma-YlaC factor YlaD